MRVSEAVEKVRETGGSGMIIVGEILCFVLVTEKLPILLAPPFLLPLTWLSRP